MQHVQRSPGTVVGESRWPALGHRAKTIVIGVLAVVLASLIVFLGTRMAWTSDRRTLQREHETRYRQVATALAATSDTNSLLRARGHLFDALTELDRRNFGLAQGHVEHAKSLLGAINPSALDLDVRQLDAARGAVESLTVAVQPNLAAQRARFNDAVERLGRVIPQEPPQIETLD